MARSGDVISSFLGALWLRLYSRACARSLLSNSAASSVDVTACITWHVVVRSDDSADDDSDGGGGGDGAEAVLEDLYARAAAQKTIMSRLTSRRRPSSRRAQGRGCWRAVGRRVVALRQDGDRGRGASAGIYRAGGRVALDAEVVCCYASAVRRHAAAEIRRRSGRRRRNAASPVKRPPPTRKAEATPARRGEAAPMREVEAPENPWPPSRMTAAGPVTRD